jgi:hypothetical protein
MPRPISRVQTTAAQSHHQHKMSAYLAGQLKPFNDRATLKMFGEDDCGSARVGTRNGPVASLTPESAAKVLGFKMETQAELDDRVLQFQKVDVKNKDFWPTFIDTQEEDGVGEKVKALMTGKNVAELVAFVIDGGEHDRQPFGADAFLMARMKDGSVVYLRGTVGGMCY